MASVDVEDLKALEEELIETIGGNYDLSPYAVSTVLAWLVGHHLALSSSKGLNGTQLTATTSLVLQGYEAQRLPQLEAGRFAAVVRAIEAAGVVGEVVGLAEPEPLV